jgi:pSer/pThr/pTyr-binding forkhead associated (FHA) protein
MGDAVFLKALTPEAQVCLGAPRVKISMYPFRVGRESRVRHVHTSVDRRRWGTAHNNDLYLQETGKVLNISREHFQIERREDAYYLVDRGSACGTLLEGIAIGGNRAGGQQQLSNGDVIIVGTSESRHVFKFVIDGDKNNLTDSKIKIRSDGSKSRGKLLHYSCRSQ